LKLGNSSVFIAIAAVVVVAALASTFVVFPSGPGTIKGGQRVATVTSLNGLQLTLQISAFRISSGGSITINVTETNTNAKPLNQSAAHDWPLQGLRINTCYTSVYPFGVAVYQGHYTDKNVSSAKPLQLFPFVPCPLLFRYISGYYFEPSSDMAVILPGTGSSLQMTKGLAASGNYTVGNDSTPFPPGQYTVAAGDEWGAYTLVYFTVV
jgi:hypothetical protein